MYVNRLERDAEKVKKKRSDALKAELQAAFDGKLKNSQKKARRKGVAAAKEAAKEASRRKVEKLEAQVKAMQKKLAIYEAGTQRAFHPISLFQALLAATCMKSGWSIHCTCQTVPFPRRLASRAS